MATTWTCFHMDPYGEVCEHINTNSRSTRCALCNASKNVNELTQLNKINASNNNNCTDAFQNTSHTIHIKSQIRQPKSKPKSKSLSSHKSHRMHKYASKHQKSKRKKKEKEEIFEFSFNYPNAHEPLFGNGHIPLMDDPELDTENNENILSFINTKLRQNNNNKKIPKINKYINGLVPSLYPHQQFGIGWCLQMEKNKNYLGGYLCDEMGVGKTIQIIALMLLTKNNDKYTFDSDNDDKYEYFDDFDNNSDDLNGFIVYDNHNNDQDYITETDDEYQTSTHSESDLDIQIRDNNNTNRNVSDKPVLKKVKLELKDENNDCDFEILNNNNSLIEQKENSHTNNKMEVDEIEFQTEVNTYLETYQAQIFQKRKSKTHKNNKNKNNNKRKRSKRHRIADNTPDLKRRKLQLNKDRASEIMNEYLLSEKRQLKKQRTLIVVPLCILQQWIKEIGNRSPGEFNVLKYHGNSKKNLKLVDLLQYDVIITTYDIICNDYNRGNDENYENTFFSHKMRGFFYRIVLDEAHIIKNPNGWKSRACAVLGKNGCKMHWVLTGTPIQNGLCDLYSLGRFLQYPQFNYLHVFKDVFRIKGNKGDYTNRETRLKILSFLNVVMLRRMKSEVIDNIVSKTEEWIEVELGKDTRVLYDEYEENAREELQDAIDGHYVRQHWVHIFEQLMRLRQICSNPDIAMKNQGVCTYSCCGDVVDKPFKIVECGHLFCAEHLEMLNGKCPAMLCKIEFNEWSNDIIDLPNKKPLFAERWREIIQENPITYTTELLYKKFNNDVASIIKQFLFDPNDLNKDIKPYIIRRKTTEAKGEYSNDVKQGEWNDLHECVEWNNEFKDDMINGYENENLFDEYDFTFIPSSKTKILIKKILSIGRDKPNDKILIYSQWTSMLNLIEYVLNKYDVGCYRYDGSLSYDCRNKIIERFNEGIGDKNVLLISLKCGSLGLNLVTANHVIFVDLWWNPAIEAQAIDRVHRIGQKKHVYVTRFVIKNSVQDRMLKIQDEKKECAEFALNGAKLLSANTMNIDVVRRLFGEY